MEDPARPHLESQNRGGGSGAAVVEEFFISETFAIFIKKCYIFAVHSKQIYTSQMRTDGPIV